MDKNTFDHLIAAVAQSLVRVQVKVVGLNQRLKLTLSQGCPCNQCHGFVWLIQKKEKKKFSPNSLHQYPFVKMWWMGGGELGAAFSAAFVLYVFKH